MSEKYQVRHEEKVVDKIFQDDEINEVSVVAIESGIVGHRQWKYIEIRQEDAGDAVMITAENIHYLILALQKAEKELKK